MNDEQLLRYSRQILLPQVDVAGQEKLLNSTLLIIGLGGLGSPAATYLAAAGVGHLIINDFDRVELSNLQRQILHHTPDIGLNKTASAKQHLQALNSDITITEISEQLNEQTLTHWASQADAVLDCSDNFQTRFLVNQICFATQTPLISAAVIRFEGQLAVFDPRLDHSPCYRCIYSDFEEQQESCSETGVLAPAAGVLGSLQATEALKLLLNIGNVLVGQLIVFDLEQMSWRNLKVRNDPNCTVCSN